MNEMTKRRAHPVEPCLASTRVIPGDQLDQIVLEINAIASQATFQCMMTVGRLIIERIYDNDLAAWRRRGRKAASFRVLTRHPDLAMSATSLYRSVALYELCSRLAPLGWQHVSPSHVRLVLPLDRETQRTLIAEAERRRWTTHQLEEAIRDLPGGSRNTRSTGGRSRRSRLMSTMARLARTITASGDLIGMSDPEDHSPESVRVIYETIDRLRDACSRAEACLSVRAPSSGAGRPVGAARTASSGMRGGSPSS